MALTLDKSVLEKLEALQNIMIASVTGGARDEAEYRQIREELFRVPGLKEALPRFVRTCGDLSQLWHDRSPFSVTLSRRVSDDL